jgi:hypothetical protein
VDAGDGEFEVLFERTACAHVGGLERASHPEC